MVGWGHRLGVCVRKHPMEGSFEQNSHLRNVSGLTTRSQTTHDTWSGVEMAETIKGYRRIVDTHERAQLHLR